MQKVNVDVHIWNELRSSDRFGFNICNHYVSNFVPKTLGDTQSAILAEKPPIAGILLPHLLRVHGGFITNHLRHITTSSLLVTEVDFFHILGKFYHFLA